MLRTRTIGRLILALAAASGIALAQRPVQPPPGAAPPPARPAPSPGDRTISPTETPSAGGRKPSCEEVKRKARFAIYFSPAVDIDKLVQTVADATCKTF